MCGDDVVAWWIWLTHMAYLLLFAVDATTEWNGWIDKPTRAASSLANFTASDKGVGLKTIASRSPNISSEFIAQRPMRFCVRFPSPCPLIKISLFPCPSSAQMLSVQLYPGVLQLWNQYTQLYFQSLGENIINDMSQSCIEKALIALRVLRKLTIFGIQEPLACEPCILFMNSIIPCIRNIIEIRVQLLTSNATNAVPLVELTEKFVLKLMKLLNEFLDTHTKSFIEFIPMSLEFAFNYVFYTGTQLIFDAQNQINFPTFAIRCINLMKNIAMKSSNEEQAPIKTEAKNEFFTVERLSYISEKIIGYYFLLTPADLEQWNDEPEQYACDDSDKSWEYDLRVNSKICIISMSKMFLIFRFLFQYSRAPNHFIWHFSANIASIW